MSISLRPIKLDEFKGKQEIKDNLKVYIKSCLHQNKPLDHILLYGLPGTGKTTLANIIANELGRRIRIVNGTSIQKNIDIINLVLTLNEFDILFIDEIHAINPQCVELLFSVMEDFAIHISLGKDFNSKVTKLTIPRFCLIGATTILGMVPMPLEQRFGITFNLKAYDLPAIIEILRGSAQKLNLNLTDKEFEQIALNTKGIPRIANKLISRVNDFRISYPKTCIKAILTKLQIIEHGLDIDDLAYMRAIRDMKRAIGLKTISQMINIDQYTIETKIEPFLLFNQYVTKAINGRTLTHKGEKFLEKHQAISLTSY